MPRSHSMLRTGAIAAGILSLAGCAIAPPSGPNVVAMPGSGKTYEQFTNEDATCRQTAAIQTGPGPSAQQTTNATVGSAVIGTALGAATGAAIGSAAGAVGGGAAVGGALGLLAGSAIGTSNAQGGGYAMQRNYDITYSQCMAAHGNTIQQPPAAVPVYAGPLYGEPDVVIYGGYGAPYGYYGYRRPYYYRRW